MLCALFFFLIPQSYQLRRKNKILETRQARRFFKTSKRYLMRYCPVSSYCECAQNCVGYSSETYSDLFLLFKISSSSRSNKQLHVFSQLYCHVRKKCEKRSACPSIQATLPKVIQVIVKQQEGKQAARVHAYFSGVDLCSPLHTAVLSVPITKWRIGGAAGINGHELRCSHFIHS